MGAEPGSM